MGYIFSLNNILTQTFFYKNTDNTETRLFFTTQHYMQMYLKFSKKYLT